MDDAVHESHPLRIVRGQRWTLIALLAVQTCLVTTMAWRKSVTNDEIAHIPAAVCYWQYQRFELYRVNPPLARFAAGLPVILAGCETDWSSFDPAPGYRPEWGVGHDFIRVNHDRYRWLLFLSRLGLIPFLWVGTIVVCCWARELAGTRAAIVAATLWVFDPNVLGNGALVTCDVPATAMGVLAAWRFWHWLKQPSFGAAYLAGVCCGLALLTKTVWIVLPPIWLACWLAVVCLKLAASSVRSMAMQAAFCGLIALVTLNAGYGFEGTFKRLGDFEFISRSLRGVDDPWHRGAEYGNCFADTVIASVPVPLPESFVQGIDEQRYDFESERGGYLGGEFRDSGFWYYYLYGVLVKEPVSVLVLLAGSVLVLPWMLSWRKSKTLSSTARPLTGALAVLAAHGLFILVLVSCQSGLNSFFRYLLPAFPFAMVGVAVAVAEVSARWRRAFIVSVVLLVAMVAESLAAFPHSLSFFNLAAGGIENGGRHLLGSNVDWGQDLGELERWVAAHPEVDSINLINTNFGPVDLYDIPAVRPVFCECRRKATPGEAMARPEPGWYAVSANYLFAAKPVRVQLHGEVCQVTPKFQEYFRGQRRVGIAGGSFHIFHVPIEDRDALP